MREPKRVLLRRKAPLTLRERPKSREESPKEGDGLERGLSRYRTATTYTASHKTQVLLTYFNCISPIIFCILSREGLACIRAGLRLPYFKVNAHKIS